MKRSSFTEAKPWMLRHCVSWATVGDVTNRRKLGLQCLLLGEEAKGDAHSMVGEGGWWSDQGARELS